ncbi:MAG: glycosyltransferase family 2 protein [Ferruginibacter sp.]
MQLSIIIVNYNVKYFLEQCLYSVQKACLGIDAEIFVVDNNSTDGSREYLEPKFPGVIFKWSIVNAGFAKANNSVLNEVMGEYILFLNPDTIIPEDCFTKCLNFCKIHPNCGAVGVRMINASGIFLKESKRSLPLPMASFFKLAGLAKLFPSSKFFARYYAGHLPQNTTNEVDALAGAFMMLSKEAVEKTQGFDESFFMYGEDIDLSYRIQKAGLKNYYFADTTILHFKGESTQKLSGTYINHFYGAMKLFVIKHYTEKKITRFFMLQAIFFSKELASLKLFFLKQFFSGKKLITSQHTAVAASHHEFNELIHLLKYAAPPVIICGRLAVNDHDKNVCIGRINTPKNALVKNKIKQVIFCEGVLSFKDIISYLPLFSKKINCFFHAANSSSIVNAGKKNSKGLFIAKP